MKSRTSLNTCQLFGVRIHALSMKDVLHVIDACISTRGQLLIGVVNAAKLVNMKRDPALGQAVESSDLILADGMAVVWACRLLGQWLPERVPGIDLMERMLAHSCVKGYRVYCLGATQAVLDRAVEQMRRQYPGVQIVGSHHGYYQEADEPDLARRIAETKPDILFVAMTSPKKERFLSRWAKVINVPIAHGVGGSFDVVAGKVKRAPWLWQRFGLEWLYRVLQEPRRMFRRYAETNILFVGMLFREIVRRFSSPAPCGAIRPSLDRLDKYH